MNSWVLALVIVGMLLLGGCAMLLRSVGDSTEEFVDFAERVYCYDSGFQDARNELEERAPGDAGDTCDDLYADGYEDGRTGTYNPPRGD